MRAFAPILLVQIAACGSGQRVFTATVDAPRSTDLFCDGDLGNFVYAGDADHDEVTGAKGHPRRFDVLAGLWASGGRADAKLDSVEWGFQYLSDPGTATNDEGGLLDLWERSHADRSGADWVVTGPTDLDVDVVLLGGAAELDGVRGEHTVTADAVFGSRLSGDLDLYAAHGGMTLDLVPEPGDTVTLQAHGDVVLSMPFGLDYDLEVIADPDWGMTVSDLGFDDVTQLPDYLHAVTGDGTVRIEVDLAGGAFVLLEGVPQDAETTGG